MMKLRKSKDGFTLVELMIVLTILIILAAVAIPNFLKAREKARDEAAQDALKAVKTAMDMYSAEKGSYPSNITSSETLKKVLGNEYWPSNINVGTEIASISDAAINANGTAYTLVSVGKDAEHCWQITENGQITPRNSPNL
ncbi:prepilin-type N-terminal cleavage/methylation domain-containing protein [Candidatus Poribacteria bacterium]|nr:prepilin-type N-terminal cleavage/methylation domain-containing protein [Candidatus Poribacteria bacterium]